ncbi:MAG: archaeosine synthase alpha-subunit [Thermoplasmata archaeon]|jgi:archaeosine synthase|nr:archaeosine synthase alpha-subunit [Thermoplasmata archaeon]
MLEVKVADGRGRSCQWVPAQGKAAMQTPGLLWPDTTFAPAPAWAQAVLTTKPLGDAAGRIELVSEGTWFHPSGATGSLQVPAVMPGPTSQLQLLSVGEELAVLHDAVGWASNPRSLVPILMEARRQAGPGRLLWAPALGTPQDYALWAYLGVDLFDASPLLLAAARGEALTIDGVLPLKEAEKVLGDGTPWDQDALVAHNLEAARRELAVVRNAMEGGTLRALVERRCYARAASVELLRRFDREHGYLEAATPRHRDVPLPAMTGESLWSPEVESFRRRFRDAYQPPRTAKVLLLMPCSARKPYKTSRSHRIFGRVLDDSGIRPLVHEVMVTSPLGLVPRDVEEVYPANQYDIPVTGHWLRDEEAIVKEQIAALLDKHTYDHVVVHTSQATFDVIRHLLPEENVRHTCMTHPTDPEDLVRLATELERLKPIVGAIDAALAGRARKLEDLRALATFQFGPEVAVALTDGAEAHGRMPYVKLVRADGVQLGTTTPGRGVLSLTIEGAKALAEAGTKRVHIQDFPIRGTSSLFAVGVKGADGDVRAGDEVVVLCDGKVRACGVAQMSAEEMTHLKRGVAVTLRHAEATA